MARPAVEKRASGWDFCLVPCTENRSVHAAAVRRAGTTCWTGQTGTLLEKGIIEVAPLAFMRGPRAERFLRVLDEAQNTTSEQMKMFLTRLDSTPRR